MFLAEGHYCFPELSIRIHSLLLSTLIVLWQNWSPIFPLLVLKQPLSSLMKKLFHWKLKVTTKSCNETIGEALAAPQLLEKQIANDEDGLAFVFNIEKMRSHIRRKKTQ